MNYCLLVSRLLCLCPILKTWWRALRKNGKGKKKKKKNGKGNLRTVLLSWCLAIQVLCFDSSRII